MTFEQATEKFATCRDEAKRYRLPGTATWLVKTARGYGVKYHDTVVVEITPEAHYLHTGGWQTAATKERIKEYLPSGFTLFQEKGEWYLLRYGKTHTGRDEQRYLFTEGMSISTKGKVTGVGTKDDAKERATLRKKIRAYSKRFIAELLAGNVSAPGLGDCLDCHMRTSDTGVPLGEADGAVGHLRSHLDENYYVPSLLLGAIELYPVAPVAQWVLQRCWGLLEDDVSRWNDIAGDQLRKSLEKYLKRQFGV